MWGNRKKWDNWGGGDPKKKLEKKIIFWGGNEFWETPLKEHEAKIDIISAQSFSPGQGSGKGSIFF